MTNIINEGMFGYIDHNYKGHKIRLHGQIIGLNEGDLTAKMHFDNGVVSDGIPMETIVLDEWSLNGIKKAANRALGYIKGKFSLIGGMIKKIVSGIAIPFNRASNIGQNVAKGLVPSGVGVYLSSQAKAEAEEAGATAKEQDAPNGDGMDSNGFDSDAAYKEFWRDVWKKVIKFKNESEGNISANGLKKIYLDTVSEKYGQNVSESLKNNPFLNQFLGVQTTVNEAVEYASQYLEKNTIQKILNEAEYTSPNDEPGLSAYRSENIPIVGMREIVDEIMGQLKVAFGTGEFDFSTPAGKILKNNLRTYWAEEKEKELLGNGANPADAHKEATRHAIKMFKQMQKSSHGAKPVMVWGAPGIGKTSIIQQCRAMFKNATKGSGTNGSTNGYDINMLECVLSKMTADDFTLPTKGSDELTGQSRVVNGVQSWIPCWQVTGNKEKDAIMDKAANLKMNTPEALAKAGIDIPRELSDFRQNMANGTRLTRTDDDSYQGAGFEDKNALPENESYKYRVNEAFDFDAEEEEMENENESTITDGGVVFFDELTRAPKGVMNVIMNLVNDRKVGEGWVLGSHWIIVCAANRFYEMTGIENTWEKAFGTRFLQYTFVPEFKDWKKWAMGYIYDPKLGRYSSKRGPQKIDQEIIDFLETMNAANINAWYEKTDDNVDTDKAAKLYANPRSWQTASDMMVRKAMEINPDKPYIVDNSGNYIVNLNTQQKLDCLKAAVGTGDSTYRQFHDWHNTRFFTNEMKVSILEHGNISGSDITTINTIEGGNFVKIPSKDGKLTAKDKKFFDAFIPDRMDAEGNPTGKKIELTEGACRKLMTEVVNYVDWADITNVKVANILAYFAVLQKAINPGSTKLFNDLWVVIFRRFVKAYMNNSEKEQMPSDLREALGQALMDNSNGDKSKYMAWMKPAHAVYSFVNGWEGLAAEGENTMAEMLDGVHADDKDFTTGQGFENAPEA